MLKDINYYMNLPWTYQVWYEPGDKAYFVQVTEIRFCTAHGDTPSEAMALFETIFKDHVQVMINEGMDIPEPVAPEDYKGNISYRTTPERHYRLAKKAKRENVSINKLLDRAVEDLIDDVA